MHIRGKEIYILSNKSHAFGIYVSATPYVIFVSMVTEVVDENS